MGLKILHTSDWHLGKVFRESNFELLPIQRQILSELIDITRREIPDILLIAGDIFDSYNPSYEAECLFYETLANISKHGCFTFVVAGNHDSPDKLRIAKPLIDGKHPIFIKTSLSVGNDFVEFENELYRFKIEDSLVKLNLKSKNITLAINCLPYISEVRLGISGDDYLKKLIELLSKEPQFTCDYFIVMSHLSVIGAQRSGSERVFQIGGIEDIPSEFFPKSANYIALGHLHRYQKVKNAVYSGSIYPFDFAEIEHEKGVCCFSEGALRFIKFENSPRIKKIEFDTIDEAINGVPEEKGFYYVLIKDPQPYSGSTIESLIKAYRDRLINWRFTNPDIKEESTFVDLSALSDVEMFIEFYKAKMNCEPSKEVVDLFVSVLEEVRNATN